MVFWASELKFGVKRSTDSGSNPGAGANFSSQNPKVSTFLRYPRFPPEPNVIALSPIWIIDHNSFWIQGDGNSNIFNLK